MATSGAIQLDGRKEAAPVTTTYLSHDAVAEVSSALRQLLAAVFVLYVKTKNFHWQMSGRNFRDYHLLLGEHGAQIFALTQDIAARARKIGGASLRPICDISRHQRLNDNNEELVTSEHMLAELRADNQDLRRSLRSHTRSAISPVMSVLPV